MLFVIGEGFLLFCWVSDRAKIEFVLKIRRDFGFAVFWIFVVVSLKADHFCVCVLVRKLFNKCVFRKWN